ncbi:MarR family winged helix-turn-helix transcriptional regulator [Cellulosilyticum sp. WCF-2]|uniref:MarR family winged helix-turn-helix transcriptional regulator n=1 Tax=Cellulosilyticum sp. WCF-2 TaxID=2497860 RepID=UPI000F8E7C17|nr:MarR family transcriptional regulator [Cellulosilyticum sp. WCF-2]QEH67345.1 MarR family transcriptional regulator [Cellulosilyticum sp. WCF-2]
MAKDGFNIEELIYAYIDEFKFLFFPEEWNSAFLDYSKNEILALLLLYRKKQVNMTEVADYIHAPLNTATGVITRLEKKQIAQRQRDVEDKRVVFISLTAMGEAFVKKEIEELTYYFKALNAELDEEEKRAMYSILNKAIKILKKGKQEIEEVTKSKPVKRITIE